MSWIILNTPQELVEHRLANKVPWYIWKSHPFNQTARISELERTKGSNEQASSGVRKPDNCVRAFLCYYFGHQQAGDAALLDSARTMGLSNAETFYALCVAGLTNALKLFFDSLEPADLANLSACTKQGYCRAASHGYLSTLLCLETRFPDQVDSMASALDFYSFRRAVQFSHTRLAQHLLHSPLVFAWAENRHHQYMRELRPFVKACLTRWRDQSQGEAFDLDDRNSQLGFYIARYLIREDTGTARDDLRFLLSIPGIAGRAHSALTPKQPNELLRLALALSNFGAAGQLLNIPAVRELSEANKHYLDRSQFLSGNGFFVTRHQHQPALPVASANGPGLG